MQRTHTEQRERSQVANDSGERHVGLGSTVVDPAEVLRPGGTMTIDDYAPATSWPPMFDGQVESRVDWLSHPALESTEVRVAPDLAVVVCRYLRSDA